MPETEPIAASAAELSAAEAVAAEARRQGTSTFASIHDAMDANIVLYESMATRGLAALADRRAVNRIAATVDVLLAPEVATHDDSGYPLACADCGRRVGYDYRRESYRHLVSPERGCFLISAESTAEVDGPGRVPTRSTPPPTPPGVGL